MQMSDSEKCQTESFQLEENSNINLKFYGPYLEVIKIKNSKA